MDQMTSPDHNPPPRTDMSTPSTEAMNVVKAIWGWYSEQSHAGYAKAIDMAIAHSTSAMREELERVNAALRERYEKAFIEQENKLAALESQAGAMRTAMEKCRDMAGIYMDCAGHHSDGDDPCPKCELAKAITAALSTQAGADLLRELTAMRGAMTERNTLSERTTDALLKRVQALEAAVKVKDDALRRACIAACNCMTKTPDPEYHAESCLYKTYREALLFDAAMSQEQDTTRNG